jgi:uncharacterized lipoprotein YmbA
MTCPCYAGDRSRFVRWSCVVITSLLGGCASTASRFYTLVPESGSNPSAEIVDGYRVEVDPVRIPAQVDRLELVTRLPGGGIAIADDDRWIAPVADELQTALSVELLHRLGGADPARATRSDSLSVRLNVERFESSPNRYALIEASWRLELKTGGRDVRVVCRTRAYEPVGAGYLDMVRGYQRAVALIADQISVVAQGSTGGVVAECPVSTAQAFEARPHSGLSASTSPR